MSPAVDNIPPDGSGNEAFVLTDPTHGFIYVDADKSGLYNKDSDPDNDGAQIDVIVWYPASYTPSPADWVIVTDVAHNPRLGPRRHGDEDVRLDAGAYEYYARPARPSGTVFRIR